MHPRLTEMLAAARLEADHSTLPEPHEPRLLTASTIAIRPARDDDRDEVAEWGGLPTGPVLVAEIDGEPVAAAAVGGEEIVAHPTRPIADAVSLLVLRARQLG